MWNNNNMSIYLALTLCQALAKHFKYSIFNYYNSSDSNYNFPYFIDKEIEVQGG